MSTIRLRVVAGPHERRVCPVCAEVNVDPNERPSLVHEPTGKEIPCQLEAVDGGARLHWMVDRLAAGQEATYGLTLGARQRAAAARVHFDRTSEEVVVRYGRKLFTKHVHGGGRVRPFLNPVIGPFGDSVVRELVTEDHVLDHKHHRGIYIAHGDVNGADNWSEEEGHGATRFREFEAVEPGVVFGRLVSLSDWITADGQKLLAERTEYVFHYGASSARLFDVNIALTAVGGDVRFGDTKEGGILSVRVATSMEVRNGGRITNSFGGVNEADTWGKRAHWCDYTGDVCAHTVGIAVMDHHRSFRSPTNWHVRNYGLMTANMFGLSHYWGDPTCRGDFDLPSGQSLCFNYRVFVHRDDAARARVADRYLDYAAPPTVDVV